MRVHGKVVNGTGDAQALLAIPYCSNMLRIDVDESHIESGPAQVGTQRAAKGASAPYQYVSIHDCCIQFRSSCAVSRTPCNEEIHDDLERHDRRQPGSVQNDSEHRV